MTALTFLIGLETRGKAQRSGDKAKHIYFKEAASLCMYSTCMSMFVWLRRL